MCMLELLVCIRIGQTACMHSTWSSLNLPPQSKKLFMRIVEVHKDLGCSLILLVCMHGGVLNLMLIDQVGAVLKG